jgi:hypothetical protein
LNFAYLDTDTKSTNTNILKADSRKTLRRKIDSLVDLAIELKQLKEKVNL